MSTRRDRSNLEAGIIRCGTAAVLFGASAPAASRLAGDMSAFSLAGLLYLGAAFGALPMLGRVPHPSRRAFRDGAGRLVAAVVFGGAVGPVLLAAGLAHTSAASSSLLLNLELVFTSLLAALLFGEHIGRRVTTGTGLVVLAGVVLAWSGSAEFRWGALLIAGACLCWALDNCVTAGLDELAPAHITLVKGVVAGTGNLTIGIVLGGGPGGVPIIGALVVGILGYGLSITLWVAGARELGAARGQLVFATAPFIGAVVAWTVLHEEVTARAVVSIVIAAVGVGFVVHSAHEHEHTHRAVEHEHEHRHDDGHHRHEHGTGVGAQARHTHRHRHDEVVHSHPHVPDLHHRHDHGDVAA